LTLQEGQLLSADKVRVIEQLENANVVVLDLTSPTTLLDMDTEIQQHLYSLCLKQSTPYFQVWWRRSPESVDLPCLANPRK
jgi:hypothetical protein